MSIKVKVGGGRTIKAVPKQGQSTSIVAPAERKPQIVPDSVVLGIDTIGAYVQQVNPGDGIVITQTIVDEAANVVIGHSDTSNAVSTTNPNLSYPKNIAIDTFGHITSFENVTLNPLNFSANSTVISSGDITIGTTSLTLGESSSTLTGLTSLDVAGPVLSNTLSIRNITDGRILFAGANGFVSDSAGLTFDGTSLIAAGGVFLDGLQVDGQADVDSLNVSDLTPTRIVYAGTGGELIDDAGLTYNKTTDTLSGINIVATKITADEVVSSGAGIPTISSASNLILDAASQRSYPGSGTTWYDLSGNGHNADIIGSPTHGELGGAKCFILDAVGKRFNANTDNNRTTNDLTLEAWIYPQDEVSSGDRGAVIQGYCYLSWNKSNRRLSNYWYSASPSGYHEPTTQMDRNRWHHLMSVWDS